jgi:DNA polymerase I
MKKLILVDGNSLVFRAYYATAYPGAKLMQTSKGVYTNALFAFVGMFEKIIEQQDTHVLVAFDTKEPTKRHQAYEQYKAGRIKMPEELAQQLAMINEYIELSGIKHYAKAGYEADDIIGTLAKRGQANNYRVEIYSSDRDLLQLVDDQITVNLLKKGMKEVHRFTPQTLFDTYQLTHQQMIDLKALMGDPSDNIPGIPGVGEKTAVKLLQTYQTLDNLLAHKDEIQGKLGEKISEHEHLAKLSKSLVEIDIDADIDCPIDTLKKQPAKTEKLISFFQKNELHVFVRQMDLEKPQQENWDFIVIQDERAFEDILKPGLAIHFEFSDYNYHKAELWGVSISDGKKHYFIEPAICLSSLNFQMYLSDAKMDKYVYDYKAIKVFLKWQNMDIEGVTFDLLLAAYLINSNIGKEEFKRIISEFEYDDLEYDDVIYGRGAKKALPEKEIYQKHIVGKAVAISKLRAKLISTLEEQDQLQLLTDLEIPLSTVLAEMEYRGLLVDIDELNRQGHQLLETIETLEKSIHNLAGQSFTVSSPKQLGKVLFEDLGLPTKKKTKTGYSTDIEVLTQLEDQHPIISEIIKYRQVTKLHSTYIEGVRQNIYDDGKVHTIYTQALTTTGRLSSLDPNLQNIPIRSEEGREIRKLFVAKENHVLLGADYSQIELRVLADYANVSGLIQAFNDEVDIHTKTAKEVFNTDQVTDEQRRAAKAVNFGIIYGIGAWSLSEDIHVTKQEAQTFIDTYLTIYPEIKSYMENIVEFAKEHTYVETLMKRRRYIPEIKSPVYQMRAFGERTALNAPIQGTAADILKKAMVDLHQYIKKHHLKSYLLLQVHDELILEVPEDEINLMKEVVPKTMQEAIKLKVELVTSCDVGKTWFDLK